MLGGLQGLVGWWMVKSGLESRVSVAPERLAIHLGLALILFCALIWTAMEAWSGQGRARRAHTGGWGFAAFLFLGLVFFQAMLGALVAGNHAGLIDNDWPLMNGYLVPPDYAAKTLWATLAHSQAAVQFNHRMVAYAVVIAAVGIAGAGLNSTPADGPEPRAGARGGRRRRAAGAAGGGDADDARAAATWRWRTRPAPRSCSLSPQRWRGG